MASAKGPETLRDPLDALNRVVLVDDVGRRTVLATHVPSERANVIANALAGICAFKSIEIVPEPVPEPVDTLGRQ